MMPTININDLPYGGDVQQQDVFPARRSDGITYKVSPLAQEVILFAGENLNLGDAVYLNSDGFIYKAIATSAQSANVLGLVDQFVFAGNEVPYSRTGAHTVLQTLITSQSYWLSAVIPGALVASPPSVSGNYIVYIGTGYNFNTIMLQLGLPTIV